MLKRIGLSNVEPHLPLILATGGASMDNERVDIEDFSARLTAEVNKRVKAKGMIKEKFLRKLHSLLTTKGLSLFDFFMRLDVNLSSKVNKTEMKTGMQALGIIITREEFEAFWKALYSSQSRVKVPGRRDQSINDRKKPRRQRETLTKIGPPQKVARVHPTYGNKIWYIPTVVSKRK